MKDTFGESKTPILGFQHIKPRVIKQGVVKSCKHRWGYGEIKFDQFRWCRSCGRQEEIAVCADGKPCKDCKKKKCTCSTCHRIRHPYRGPKRQLKDGQQVIVDFVGIEYAKL